MNFIYLYLALYSYLDFIFDDTILRYFKLVIALTLTPTCIMMIVDITRMGKYSINYIFNITLNQLLFNFFENIYVGYISNIEINIKNSNLIFNLEDILLGLNFLDKIKYIIMFYFSGSENGIWKYYSYFDKLITIFDIPIEKWREINSIRSKILDDKEIVRFDNIEIVLYLNMINKINESYTIKDLREQEIINVADKIGINNSYFKIPILCKNNIKYPWINYEKTYVIVKKSNNHIHVDKNNIKYYIYNCKNCTLYNEKFDYFFDLAHHSESMIFGCLIG